MEENFRCIPNIGYFGSVDFITFALQTITFLSVPIHLFGLFLIIAKSKNDLASSKWSILHCHVATSFFNVTVTLLTQPFLLLPAMAGVPNGALRNLGVDEEIEFYILMVGLALMALSDLSLIECRFSLIFTKAGSFWRKFRRFWSLLHYSGVLGILILAIFTIPDQEEARQVVYKNLPCLPVSIYTSSSVFVLAVSFSVIIITFTIFILVIIAEVIFFIMLFFLFSAEQVQSGSISKKQFETQNLLFKKFTCQIAIPLITLLIPLFYATYSVFFHYFNAALNNLIVVLICSSHGPVSSIVMIVALYQSVLESCRIDENRISQRRSRGIQVSVHMN